MILSEMKAFPKLDIYYMYPIGQGKRLSLAEKLDYSHVRESLCRWLLELHNRLVRLERAFSRIHLESLTGSCL
jgi:hypothetical protein